MVRRAYHFAVAWIAENDEPTMMDVDLVEDLISVQLVADLWEKKPGDVALDVVGTRLRRKDG